MAERDRARLAAVLAADAELDPRLRASSALDCDAHQLADALDVEHLERVPLEDPLLEVEGEELPLCVVAGEADLAVQMVSELLSVPGAQFVGPLPAEINQTSVIEAGILAGTRVSGAARQRPRRPWR